MNSSCIFVIHQNKIGGTQMNIQEIVHHPVEYVNTLSIEKNYDKYSKKYKYKDMLMYLLTQQFSGDKYGRGFTIHLKTLLGETTETLSQSELSKKMSYKLDYKVFRETYKNLLKKTKTMNLNSGLKKELKEFEENIRIIDSSALSATSSMGFAKHRQNKNGFKLHVAIDNNNIPQPIVLKNGKSSDKKSLKWAIKEGFVHIFDRGYNDYSQFEWIQNKNGYFVTRALQNIRYTKIRQKKVGRKQKEKGIISDKIIEVITDKKLKTTFIMRMVTFKFIDSRGTEQIFSFLTNLIDVRSDVISELYKERWNIEVVFYWIKTYLEISHWLSRSKNGVLIQIYVSLIAYLMVKLAQEGDPIKFKIMRDAVYEFTKIILISIENDFCGNSVSKPEIRLRN